ncbi:autotransporter outer membrane beta-barrel domain-containing protein [Pseudomonas sp. Bout1]|uniref:autotransporter outer membrane beta-barrel domain-containing protein n=1 Tax=Pseudomonas sp. Bout1 TaxID=3048600 RepID=UPI002AB37B6B|nr:autotransporter outer membrane beta-barrel domain-containing protein [Pseudomonas sp. Bout1]MDY7536237.1 autotransporter outer membrane beta-barrel domain-containing protein [Pseudomonas sp. Bout1]MEB0183599.1 autotransporter outer membrane beta-barrel domain-containing protein [Pseudomonas sp. Bout1]
MPLIQKQLALAVIFALGFSSAQFAHAREDIDPDSEWIEIPVDGKKTQHRPVQPVPAGDFHFADHATTRNGQRVAQVLDHGVATLLKSGELNEWQEYELENLSRRLANLKPGRLGEVLEQLAGSQNANLASATQNSMTPLNTSLLSAMRQLSDERNAGNDQGHGRLWLHALGSAGKLEGQHASAGLQQRTRGLVLGGDWALDDSWRVGVMGAKSASELRAARFKGELDSWHLGGYAVRQDGPLALRLGVIYSRHAGETKRTVDVDFAGYREQSQGKYTAHSQNAFTELGYQLDKGGFSVEPFAGLGYQRYHRDRYTEKGRFTALNVGAQTQGNFSSTFGLRVASAFELDNWMTLKPHLSTGWKHLYGDVSSTVRQSLAWVKRPGFNSDFTLQGTSLGRDSLAVQAGVDLALSAQHTVGLAYSAEAGSHSRNQGVKGQWTLAF